MTPHKHPLLTYSHDVEDGKYNIRVVAPQLLENVATFEVANNTVKSKSFDRHHGVLNIRVHPIDFTVDPETFDIWSLIKNPIIIMALVSLGLISCSKLTMAAADEEETRMMKHPDIILANGDRVDPTKLVPKFI